MVSPESTPTTPPPASAKAQPASCRCGKFGYLVLLLSVAWLAFTGIGTFVFGHPPMTHWVLMAHVAVAPIFAIGLAWVALAWSGKLIGGVKVQSALRQILFWLILLCGLVVILSGVVPMLPIFGTDGQHLLYLTHRYSAIVLAIAVVGHLVVKK